MKPPAETLKESLTQSRRELTDFMRVNKPAVAARELEKAGWSREWACAAVETVEYKYNPAGLSPDAKRSQEIREKLYSRTILGGGIFVICFLIAAGALIFSGKLVLAVWGLAAFGAVMCLTAYPQLGRYPDRPLPRYAAPRNSTNNSPADF